MIYPIKMIRNKKYADQTQPAKVRGLRILNLSTMNNNPVFKFLLFFNDFYKSCSELYIRVVDQISNFNSFFNSIMADGCGGNYQSC